MKNYFGIKNELRIDPRWEYPVVFVVIVMQWIWLIFSPEWGKVVMSLLIMAVNLTLVTRYSSFLVATKLGNTGTKEKLLIPWGGFLVWFMNLGALFMPQEYGWIKYILASALTIYLIPIMIGVHEYWIKFHRTLDYFVE